MHKLLLGETAEYDGRRVIINNAAACEIEFMCWPNGQVTYTMTDRRNPVNRNTIVRWLGFVTKHFGTVEGKVPEIA